MLTWEYPPLIVGGLGRHVEALARALVAQGHEVQVVTRSEKDEVVDEVDDGVHVRRAARDPLAIDFTTESLLAWSLAAEHSLLRAALPLVRRRRPDIVHAHDWLVGQSASTLAAHTARPLVVTVHATETGRNQGWLPTSLNLAIHSVERWLAGNADAVITCSTAMRTEVAQLFELAPESVDVVPNGIELDRWRVARPQRDAARRHVVFVGRLEHEKGLQTLLRAVRRLRRTHPQLRLSIAGTGSKAGDLQAEARRLRLGSAVTWLGFVPDDQLLAVLATADAAVVPSLYEPFGLVALEAAAARVPVVVARTGGLADLATDGVAAAAFAPGDAGELAVALEAVLGDPAAARRAVTRASRVIARDYTWPTVAARTARIYERVAR